MADDSKIAKPSLQANRLLDMAETDQARAMAALGHILAEFASLHGCIGLTDIECRYDIRPDGAASFYFRVCR